MTTVMGYDDREIAQHLHPPLSTVLLPHFKMGSIAAELLVDAAGSGVRPRQIKVECPIVMRKSVRSGARFDKGRERWRKAGARWRRER